MTETQRKWPDFVSQRDIIAQHEAAVSMLMEEIKRLEAEVERLKCCGNCKFIDGIYCNQDDKGQLVVNNWHYCDNWQSDNLTQKERET